jgi:hypothetical protein
MPLLLALLACTPSAEPESPARACNGAEALCARPFDALVVGMAHNAMSNAAEEWRPPNEAEPFEAQLDGGLRGFMLDVHPWEGEAWLCHGYCELGRERLADGLGRFGRWLDAHPEEVVVFVFERYVAPAAMEAAFAEAGLLDRVHAQAPGAPWPTVGDLLDAGTPIVAFDQDPVAELPWLHHAYTWGFDTPYAAETPEELSCEVLRGDASASIFLMNHFLTDPVATPELAAQVNFDPLLSERVDACEAERGAQVDWIALDFALQSDLIALVERLNAAR